MTQPPASRLNAPITSVEGEEEVTASGRRQSHHEMVLTFLRAHPGATGHEIGTGTGLGQVPCIRRLNDLHRLEVVRQGDPRKGPTGRREVTWWPVDEQLVLFPVRR